MREIRHINSNYIFMFYRHVLSQAHIFNLVPIFLHEALLYIIMNLLQCDLDESLVLH